MSATAITAAAGVNTAAGSLQVFEGFLKRAGRLVGVVLADIAKLALPISGLLAAISPKMQAPEAAFVATVQLIGNAVIAVEQKWAAMGTAAGAQKLADALLLVEQPAIALFAEAGITIDTGYIVNLINAVVGLLNAQPADVLATLISQAPNRAS